MYRLYRLNKLIIVIKSTKKITSTTIEINKQDQQQQIQQQIHVKQYIFAYK